MKSYAGIGSRDISLTETVTIRSIAKELSSKYILYSGNAEGSDISFQEGSDGRCVLMLPWKGFNEKIYQTSNALDWYDLGKSKEGAESIKNFHPSPNSLTDGGKKLMSRNYHQIVGYDKYPRVSFVICCATPSEKGVSGGTGQAVRIAGSLDIPIINIRIAGWELLLKEISK